MLGVTYAEFRYPECKLNYSRYYDCHMLSFIMLRVIILSGIRLIVNMLNVVAPEIVENPNLNLK
jgi:hypothetical protein